jgi:chromosome segregation ATPase
VPAVLDLVRSLEARDDELAVAAGAVEEARREAEDVGQAARRLQSFLDDLPAARARLAEASAAARTDVDRARAERERVRASDEPAPGEVRRAEAAVQQAAARLRRAVREEQALEERAGAVPEQVAALDDRARRGASLLASIPALATRDVAAPASGLEGVLEWAPRARAAALVTRGRIDREREALVRQAEEAAARELGEPFAGASVQVVRRRLESRSRG